MWAFFLSKDNNFEKDPIALSGLHNFTTIMGSKLQYLYVQISAEKLADFVKVSAGLVMIRPPAIESWSSGKIVCGRGWWLVWEENQDHLVGPWNFLMLKKKMKFVV